MPNTILEAALAMAARGFFVCPLQPGSKVPFARDTCEAKYRSVSGGQHIATRDAETIKRWYSVVPDLNYGVCASGLVILDVDVKNGKDGLWDLLELGDLPTTFAVQTPSGGVHYYFTGAEVGMRPLTKALDIKSGMMGYVVGPGSIIEGEAYTIVCDAPPATVPVHLHERCMAPRASDERSKVEVTELDRPKDIVRAVAWLKLEPPPSINRNIAAFSLACRLKDFGLRAPTIHTMLQEHWNARGDDPLPDGELEACAENAFKSGRYAPGCASLEEEFGDVATIISEISKARLFGPIAPGRAAKDRPSRPWLVKGMLLKGACTLLSAQPGARKSTFLVGLACGLAAGTLKHLGYDWTGEPMNTMVINNEDDENEVDRRVEACCTLNGFDYEEIKKRIFTYKPKKCVPFKAVVRDRVVKNEDGSTTTRKGLSSSAELDLLAHEINVSQIAVVIADPLASLHDGAENDNGEMNRVFSFFNQAAAARHLPIMLAHHSRKPDAASSESYAGDPFSSRGASAIHGTVRLMLTLNTASAKDGAQLGLRGEDEHLNYCRLDTAKDSNSTLGLHTKWLLCEGVNVGNPDDSDTAPALKVYEHKTQFELLAADLHKYLRQAADGFDKNGKMSMQDAIDVLASVMPIDDDTAQAYIETHFKAAHTREGVTLKLVGKGKKASLVNVLNCGTDPE